MKSPLERSDDPYDLDWQSRLLTLLEDAPFKGVRIDALSKAPTHVLVGEFSTKKNRDLAVGPKGIATPKMRVRWRVLICRTLPNAKQLPVTLDDRGNDAYYSLKQDRLPKGVWCVLGAVHLLEPERGPWIPAEMYFRERAAKRAAKGKQRGSAKRSKVPASSRYLITTRDAEDPQRELKRVATHVRQALNEACFEAFKRSSKGWDDDHDPFAGSS